jgi:hypothetical protein
MTENLEPMYLYIGLIILIFSFLQYCCGVAIYFSILSAIKSGDIVKRKENPDKFNNAIIIQVATGCFFILLELLI